MKRSGKLAILLVAFLAVSTISMPEFALAGVRTQVVVHKSVLVNLNNPVARVSVAKPEIADVLLISPRQIQLIGMAIGSTTLVVWEKGGGKPLFFDVNVTGDESQLKEIAPNDDISVSYAKDTVILSGKANSQQTIDKVVQVAKTYAPNVINHVSIDDSLQVLLQVKVAQIDKTALKNLGVSYLVKGKNAEGFSNMIGAPDGGIGGSSTGSTTTTTTSSSTTTSTADVLSSFSSLNPYTMGISYFPAGIGAVIKALATKNLAKILAEPNLLVKSGKKGAFLAGSKIPYNIVTSTGGTATTSIVFQEVGVKLTFAPNVLADGKIQLNIDPAEVSTVSGSLTVNGYPIIDTREVRTDVELKDGESLVLAGLLQENDIKTMSKVPWLGDIPILGALFRTTGSELKETELVFFITPKIVKPLPPGTKPDLPTDKKLTPEQEREMQWIPTFK